MDIKQIKHKVDNRYIKEINGGEYELYKVTDAPTAYSKAQGVSVISAVYPKTAEEFDAYIKYRKKTNIIFADSIYEKFLWVSSEEKNREKKIPKKINVEFIEMKEKRRIVAIVRFEDGSYRRGEAVCHPEDEFNRFYGMYLAMGRAMYGEQSEALIPDLSMVDDKILLDEIAKRMAG